MLRKPRKKIVLLLSTFLAAVTMAVGIPALTANAQSTSDDATVQQLPVSEEQFNDMFPNRNEFYTYDGFVEAASAFPAFGNTGDETVQARDVAAFLANASHETGGLWHIVEEDTSNYPNYCDESQSFGCPAGHDAYYGRGPLQLSWNTNYNAAGNELGRDLLNDPWQVENEATVAWETALWFWVTQSGAGNMSGHTALTTDAGFGESIRSINGSIECDGGNPGQVQSRIDLYEDFTSRLGVTPGDNLGC